MWHSPECRTERGGHLLYLDTDVYRNPSGSRDHGLPTLSSTSTLTPTSTHYTSGAAFNIGTYSHRALCIRDRLHDELRLSRMFPDRMAIAIERFHGLSIRWRRSVPGATFHVSCTLAQLLKCSCAHFIIFRESNYDLQSHYHGLSISMENDLQFPYTCGE